MRLAYAQGSIGFRRSEYSEPMNRGRELHPQRHTQDTESLRLQPPCFIRFQIQVNEIQH